MTDITRARELLKEALILISPRENGEDKEEVTDKVKIEYLLHAVPQEDSFYGFIEDMSETLKRYGCLTTRQTAAVAKSYERAKRETEAKASENVSAEEHHKFHELSYGNPDPSDDIPF